MYETSTPQEREEKFNRFVVAEYLKYGSVDEVFKKNNYDLPISYPGVHRLIDKWGIVKAVGPNSKLSEAITFLVLLSNNKIPLERLYKKLPMSFKTSMSTMHRILHYVRQGMIRRYGCALVISGGDSNLNVLVGDDISTPRLELGKAYGATSLPMGFSRHDEDPKISIKRVLQQEIFTNDTIQKSFPEEVIQKDPKPFMYFDVVDVRVAVYHLVLAEKYKDRLSSFKLKDHRFLDSSDILNNMNFNFRYGVKEIIAGYDKYLGGIAKNLSYLPARKVSVMNQRLAEAAVAWELAD